MFFSFQVNRRGILAVCAAFLIGIFLGVAKLYSSDTVPANAPAQEGIPVPVIMYHSILKDSSRQGKYVISPAELESDMKYLKSHGYTAVTVRDLIEFVNSGTDLPEKPVMLTFDDGYYNNYLYAYPLAKKYDMKIIIAPIGYYTDLFSESGEENGNYSHLTWKRIEEMIQSGMVEFQNHSYNLHSSEKGGRIGTRQLNGEGFQEYAELLTEDLNTMQRKMTENTGYTPTAFVYPFGLISKQEPEIIEGLGFQCTFTCEERTNYLTRDSEKLFGLGRYLRPSGKESAAYFQNIGVE